MNRHPHTYVVYVTDEFEAEFHRWASMQPGIIRLDYQTSEEVR